MLTAPALAPPRNNLVQVAYTPIPEDAQLPPLPTRADRAFGYQKILLNVRTGQLSIFCGDWRVRPARDAQRPGDLANTQAYNATEPVPEVLCFHVDTWTPTDWPADQVPPTPAWVYMTREQCDTFGAGLVPLAQAVASNLFRVPGTDELEWSAESVAAERALTAACGRDQQGTYYKINRAGIIDFGEAVAAKPEVVNGGWAEMDDVGLDREADSLCRFTGRWHPDLKEQFGVPYHDGSGIGLDVYGARAWLYAYRAHEANNRQIVTAAAWFADPAHTLTRRVSADHSDDDLEAIAVQERTAAAKAGAKLVGAEQVIRTYRDELRQHIVKDDLPRARKAVEQLAKAKAARAGLLGQIIGWGDPSYHSDNDAELGRQAGMTRQAVNQLRKALTDDDDA